MKSHARLEGLQMFKFLKLTDERWKQLDGSYGGVKGEFHYSLLDQVIPVDP